MTYADIERRWDALERGHVPALTDALAASGRLAARAVRAGTWPAAMASDEGMADALADLYVDAITTSGRAVERELSDGRGEGRKDLDVSDPWYGVVMRFIESVGVEMVQAIGATTLSLLREIISEGVTSGLSAQQTARAIEQVWPDIVDGRATVIARTEILRATNFGAIHGARRTGQLYGIEMEKVWLATSDHRTRDSHDAVNGQRRALGEPFDVGGHPADYPGDPRLPASESIQCRCTVVFEPVEAARTWRDERNARIRADYPALRDAEGQLQAFATLAEREGLSESYIKDIVYKGNDTPASEPG